MGFNLFGWADDLSVIQQPIIWTCAVALASTALLLHHAHTTRKISAKMRSFGTDVRLPPHVRSFVPVLGSALEMGRGIRKFIDKYSKQFQQPIFTATIGGDHCLFIGDPDHCTMVHKYSKYLDEFALQKQFSRNVLGFTDEKELDYIFSPDENESSKEALRQYRHYLFSSDELNKTIGAAQKVFEKLVPKLLLSTAGCSYDECNKLNLYAFVQECVFKASIAPLLSRHVATKETMQLYISFEKGIRLMFADAPSFLTKDSRMSRDELIHMISDERFVEEGSDLIKARKQIPGFSENTFNRSMLGLFFASVGNSIPSVFWCLCHIIADKNAYQQIRNEVESIFSARRTNKDSTGSSGGFTYFTIEELDRMVLLESAFLEALRLYHGAFTTRQATEDFIFDPKKKGQSRYLIEKGTRIMSFMTIKHHDAAVFDDPDSYQFDRFAPSEMADGSFEAPIFTKDGKRVIEPVRPFGGGTRLCPGRKFISYEMRAFAAILVSKYDMNFVEGKVPEINFATQGIGVSHPENDVEIEVRMRETCIRP